jgi:hypothetical protein
MAAGMLAHHQGRLAAPDRFGRHDLIGLDMLEHAVLVDARLVGEGVTPNDRLVVLDRKRRHRRHQLRCPRQQLGIDAGGERQHVGAGAQRHDDLFQRRVAGPLADAVDGAFDLPGTGGDAGQRVGHRKAEIVVAMGREHDLVGAGHPGAQHGDEGGIFLRHRVADGVGNIDGRGAGLDRRLAAAAQESCSVRVASSALHSTSSTSARARVTEAMTMSRTSCGSFCSFHFMCTGEVEMKVWMRGRRAWRTASPARSTSLSPARARPATTALSTRLAISDTASKSPSDAMGKPASMMSTPMVSSNSATWSFSSRVMVAPGDCSPSRNVVSKIKTPSPCLAWLV